MEYAVNYIKASCKQVLLFSRQVNLNFVVKNVLFVSVPDLFILSLTDSLYRC